MNVNQGNVEPGQEARSEDMREQVGRDIDQFRRIGEEGLEDLREIGGQIRQRVEDEIRARPLVALGVAFGAGVVVSSLMSSRIARLAILAAGGYAAREMFGDRLIEALGSREEEEEEHRARRTSRREQRQGGGSQH